MFSELIKLNQQYLYIAGEYGSDDGSEEESDDEEEVIGPDGQKITRKKKKSKSIVWKKIKYSKSIPLRYSLEVFLIKYKNAFQ